MTARSAAGTPARRGAGARRNPAPARSRSQAGPATPAHPAAERAALGLWALLCALALARAALAFAPSMWAWAINLHRFQAPLAAIALWLAGAVVLVPNVARRLEPALSAAGDAIGRGRGLATTAWVAGAIAAVLLLPDRTWFVGDFLLRQSMVEVDTLSQMMLLQAQPLERFLHNILPRTLVAMRAGLDANGAARLLGAAEAGILAWLAVRFARGLGLRGVAAVGATAVVLCGGYLGLYTGYGKAAGEMVVLALAIAVFGQRVALEGRGLLPLGLAVALGILVHRAALGFLPALALACSLWLRRSARAGGLGAALRTPSALLGLGLPVAALLWTGPHVLATLTGFDARVHYASPEIQAEGGMLRAALSGLRPLDLVNLLVLYSPAVWIVPLVFAARVPMSAPRAVPALLLTLALPFVILMLVVRSAQGTFRDWDVFAVSGVTLSLVYAWLAGEVFRRAPRHGWVAVGLVISVAVASLGWLASQAGRGGLERVQAYVSERPHRGALEAGQTWEYLGSMRSRRGERQAAAAAMERAAALTPSPTVLRYWAVTEVQVGRLDRAREILRRLVARDPGNRAGWLSLAGLSFQLGDSAAGRAELARVAELDAHREPGAARPSVEAPTLRAPSRIDRAPR